MTARLAFLAATFAAGLPLTPSIAQTAAEIYAVNCASCHGADLRGGGASSLADGDWQYGVGHDQVFRRIKFGIEEMGMPNYQPLLSDAQVNSLVTFIYAAEAQQGNAKRRPEGKDFKTQLHNFRMETVVAEGSLSNPWAIDWVSPTHALITEKGGTLRMMVDGKVSPEPVQGTPPTREHGQGGLMEVAVDPDYTTTGWVYLGHTHPGQSGLQTRIVRGKIKDNKWIDEQVLFQAKPEHYSNAGVHFGCRIVFDKKGHLFFAIGDRGNQNQAQDLTRPNGKVHRINRDGSIPKDNPFVSTANAYPSIFSYGNRNAQGLAIHPETDELWATEHGPMGGDELNWIRAGKNYGWPVITYGKNYNGTIISNLTEKEGMEQPAAQWTPSLAVCGLDFYAGDKFPKWKNNLLVGALAFQEVRRVEVTADGKMVNQELLLKNQGRVRDVGVGPDGLVYVVLNGPDKIVRLVPESSSN